jgi:curved DNA-binding protein CbpA
MARIHTHYDNLKVARNAPPEIIRAAYKTLSQKYHPDRNPDSRDAIRIIQIINLAYEVLSDPAKRQEHDEWIARTEAEDQKTDGPAKWLHPGAAAKKQTSEHERRRTSSNTRRRSRRESAFKAFLSLEKVRLIWGQFFRNLFRKV